MGDSVILGSVAPRRRVTRKSTFLNLPSCADNLKKPLTRRSVVPSNETSKDTTTQKRPLLLSQEPKTPEKSNLDGKSRKTKYHDPIMARLQKDLNSPSANARVRANRALKDPDFRTRNYGQFDVPYERQDLITDEERKPIKPKTNEEIFGHLKIYVEVRTGDDNRSAGVKNHLLRNGIKVNEKLYKNTTHVVFKEGLLSTYKNAKKLGIPITTILWADACLAQKRLVDPENFKISNLDRYERPELYKRLRRQKSMQPEISKLVNPHSYNSIKKSITKDSPQKILENEKLTETTEQTEMELTLRNEDLSFQVPEVTKLDAPIIEKAKVDRRFTTFTPQPMEQTGVTNSSILHLKRKTLFGSQSTKEHDGVLTPEGNGFSANSGNTTVFNSSNRISKFSRRSVFDISMNILELNCKAQSQKDDDLPISEKKLHPSTTLISCDTLDQTQLKRPVMVRKRKLFNVECVEDIDCSKENLNNSVETPSRKAKTPLFNTPQMKSNSKPKIDRRRTLAIPDYFRTEKHKEAAVKPKTPVKQPVSPKCIVCTNMSSKEKKIIHAAVEKLGGKVETEVSSKTTHVVSSNEERTMNILRGVIRACFIVNVNWIFDSLAQEKWLETTTYQHEICDSNKVYERSVLGTKNYKNSSFANRGSFYLIKETIDNVKKTSYLKEVIELCGGTITEKKAEARYIVSDQPVPSKDWKQIEVNSKYIFDSAMKGTLVEVTRNYNPSGTKD